MSEFERRAEALGIPKGDLRKAMLLIRDFRAKCLLGNLDPRAVRIALLFAERIDRVLARKKISPAVEIEILKISSAIAQEVMGKEAPPHD